MLTFTLLAILYFVRNRSGQFSFFHSMQYLSMDGYSPCCFQSVATAGRLRKWKRSREKVFMDERPLAGDHLIFWWKIFMDELPHLIVISRHHRTTKGWPENAGVNLNQMPVLMRWLTIQSCFETSKRNAEQAKSLMFVRANPAQLNQKSVSGVCGFESREIGDRSRSDGWQSPCRRLWRVFDSSWFPSKFTGGGWHEDRLEREAGKMGTRGW